MKPRGHGLQIAYVLTLTVGAPLAIAGFFTLFAAGCREETTSGAGALPFLPPIVFWCAVIALGIANMVQAVRAGGEEHALFCADSMLIMKYGLVLYFIVNFISYALLLLAMFAATRGILLFAFPIVLLYVGIGAAFTWLAMLPGSAWAIRSAWACCRAGKTGIAAFLLHVCLQLMFLTDVPDAMFLAVRHFGRGKAGAVILSLLYLAAAVGAAVGAGALVRGFMTS